MKPSIAIIGKGNVGSALQRGLSRAGYQVKTTGKEPRQVRRTAQGAELVVLAVPYLAIDDTLRELGDAIEGKPLVDVTNALTKDMRLAVGCSISAAEELQQKAPRAMVVKCFNTSLAQHMDSGRIDDEPISAFAASDHDEAKRLVLRLAEDIGFDAVDAGPLMNARWLETLGYLDIQLAYMLRMGPKIGFRLVRGENERAA